MDPSNSTFEGVTSSVDVATSVVDLEEESDKDNDDVLHLDGFPMDGIQLKYILNDFYRIILKSNETAWQRTLFGRKLSSRSLLTRSCRIVTY